MELRPGCVKFMMDLSLGEIAVSCGGKLVLRGDDASDMCVSSVERDSREVTKQGAFVAIVGERVDGHRFITSVFEKGAALAITQKTPEQVEAETGISSAGWGSYILVDDTLQALKDFAEYYRRKFSIPVVGITGSVGKTSTKEFIAGVLAEKYNVLKTEGNYNNEIGVPLTLLRIRREHTAAVVEMGISDFGEMHRLSKMVRPNVCVITNIGQCHLENLKSRNGILKAKTEIFDFMEENAYICLNGEDDKLRTITNVKGSKPHFFGRGNVPMGEVTADNIVSHGLWGSDAVLTLKAEQNPESREEPGSRENSETGNKASLAAGEVKVHVPLPGEHNVLNSAAAACVGRLLGLSLRQIAEGISKIKPVSGRNNLIRLKDHTLIDDCYNANPASMKAAIDLLTMADTEKVAILGDMFELGDGSRSFHEEIGAYAVRAGIDRIYCVGEESEYMYKAAIAACTQSERTVTEFGAKDLAAADSEESCAKISYFPSREDLRQALQESPYDYLPKGSTVLVKASHGMKFSEIVEFMKTL